METGTKVVLGAALLGLAAYGAYTLYGKAADAVRGLLANTPPADPPENLNLHVLRPPKGKPLPRRR